MINSTILSSSSMGMVREGNKYAKLTTVRQEYKIETKSRLTYRKILDVQEYETHAGHLRGENVEERTYPGTNAMTVNSLYGA